MTTATPGPRTHAALFAAALGVLAVVAALIAGALDHDAGPHVVGALIGAVVVIVFFGLGGLVVDVVATVMPAASLLIALLTYVLQVVLLGIVFVALAESGITDSVADAGWISGTVIAGTLAWTIGQVVGEVRSRQPIFGSAA